MLGEGMGGGSYWGCRVCCVVVLFKTTGADDFGGRDGGGGGLGLGFQLKYIRLNYRPVRDVEELG